MNTYLKLASAATLSAVAVSVAALSVPAVQVQALKLIERLGISQALVTNVTVKPDNVVRAPELDDTILIGLGALDLTHLASDGGENAGGVLPVSKVLAGNAGTSGAGGQGSMAGGSGFSRGGGGSSSSNGLGGGSRGAGGGNAGPAGAETGAGPDGAGPDGAGEGAGAGVPDGEQIASNETPSGPGNPGVPGSNPSLVAPLPVIVVPGDSATLVPGGEEFADAADLPEKIGDGLGNNPGDLTLIPVLQPAVALAEVPEPGTLALLGIALLGLGAFRRQRARK